MAFWVKLEYVIKPTLPDSSLYPSIVIRFRSREMYERSCSGHEVIIGILRINPSLERVTRQLQVRL